MPTASRDKTESVHLSGELGGGLLCDHGFEIWKLMELKKKGQRHKMGWGTERGSKGYAPQHGQ